MSFFHNYYLKLFACWLLFPLLAKATNAPNHQPAGYMENKGQILDQNLNPNFAVKYLFHSNGLNVQLRENGFSYDLYQNRPVKGQTNSWETHYHRVDVELKNANPNPKIVAEEANTQYFNYYNEFGGYEGVKSFKKITYQNIYPNIDLEFLLTTGGDTKYNFVVKKGGNPADIQLDYQGASHQLVDNQVKINSNFGVLTENIPYSYQTNGETVEVLYKKNKSGAYGFEVVSNYDPNQTLIIDPLPNRNWATYYGGAGTVADGNDEGYELARRAGGDGVYLMGRTTSASAIATAGAFQTVRSNTEDLFLVSMNTSGSRAWATYYGGAAAPEQGGSIATDDFGNIYLVAVTGSSGLSFGTNPHQPVNNGNNDLIIACFAPAGTRTWATYYGGTLAEDCRNVTGGVVANNIAVSPSGSALYVCATSRSTSNGEEVATFGTHQDAASGVQDAFLVRLNAFDGSRIWATYYGGTNIDEGYGVAIGTNDTAFICGQTLSTGVNIIATIGAHDVTLGTASSGSDGFIAKIEPDFGTRIWGTYYGGAGLDDLYDIVADASGNIYALGVTTSTVAIGTAGAHQTTLGGGSGRDAYLIKFNTNGVRQWGTYFGGTGTDEGYDLAINGNDLFIGGLTTSSANIASANTFQAAQAGGNDAFLAKFNQNGAFQWATYYGDTGNDLANGVAVDNLNNIYIAGATNSTANISTPGAHQTTYAGASPIFDAFIVQFSECAITATISSSTSVTCFAGTNGSATVTVSGGTSPYTYLWSNNQSTATATGLIAGVYTVTATDASACLAITSVTISQPSDITVSSLGQTNVSCFGGNNGTASVTLPSGGTGTFTYNWSPGNPTGDGTRFVSGLTAGVWQVVVADANACSKTVNFTITQPATALTTSLSSQTNVACFGGNNGAFTISATGGTPSYQFNRGTGNQPTGAFTGLTAGNYTVTVTDANGCTTTRGVTITQPATALTTSIASQTNVACFGANSGAFTISATGGTASYQFNRGTGNQPTGAFTGLAAGNYIVTVTDANSCTTTQAVTITQPASALTTSIASQTNVACFGANSGAFTISATGGTTSYQFNRGTGNQPTGAFTGLTAGNYTVTVTDANGCTTTRGVTITQPATALTTSIASQTNVACFGGNSGAFTITATGGTASYQFNRGTGNQPTGAFSGLTAGNYTVTVTDANSCTTTQAVTITQPATALTTSIASQTNVACFGGNSGAFTISATGGTASYQFNRGTGNQPTGAFTGLTAGNYIVTVTDANGCTTTQAVTITQPATALTTSIASQTNVACFGANSGAFTITATGGTASYQFNRGTGNQPTGVFTGLTAGNYTVTVTDANSCTTTQAVTITQPATALTTSITSQTNVSCFGGNNGAFTISATGGTASYQFNRGTGNQPTGAFTGLTAGNYTVTVTDANGCTTTRGVTITQPATALTTSISSQTNVACFGGNSGAFTISATGGTASYQFNRGTGNQPTGAFTGLTAGNYTVTVTDANGCTTTQAVTITQPATALTTSIASQTNVACFGANDGAFTITATGGTASYQFNRGTGNQPTGVFTNLTAGNYTVTVTDANSCTTTQAVTITQPASALTTSITSQTNVACFGGNNGAFTITATGGTASYQFNRGTGNQPTGAFTGLTAGNYTVTVTDANGCTTTQAVTITQPASALSSSTSATQASCGTPNGTATVTATGGTATYNYLWSNNQTTATAVGLAGGIYFVTVTDANGCSTTNSATVTQPSSLSGAISSQTNVSCFGGTNGSLLITATGGTSPYQFNRGTGNQATGSFINLSAGVYNITITDAGGCTANVSATITQPATALTTSISSQTNVACFGGNNGAFTITATGGTASYQFNRGTGNQPTGAFTNLTAGNYTVTVTDANGCTTTQAVTITQPASALTTSISSQTSVACFGGNNGAFTISATGGTASYQFNRGTGNQPAGVFLGLTAGNYTVTVTDANSCTTTQAVTIAQPASALTTSINSQTNVACFGGNNGAFTITATGGTASYQFNRGTGNQPTGAFTGLTAGNYTVTVTDANSCTTTRGVTITQPAATLSITTASTDISCAANTDGTISTSVSGGAGSYTYLWSNNATTANLTGLAANSYTVTVSDANGCQSSRSVTISAPSAITLSVSSTNSNCSSNSGTATASVSGGTSPYNFAWSNARTTNTITGLAPNVYTITVTDNNGCTANSSVTISLPASPSITLATTNLTCNGSNNGSVNSTVTGGTSPYNYLWSNNATTANINTLAAGAYRLTVTDNLGCTATSASTVTQPAILAANLSIVAAGCGGSNTGSATANPTGGTGAYTYIWSNNVTTAANTGLVAGTYTITVTDANLCFTTATANITQAVGGFAISFTTNSVSCFMGADGSSTVSASGANAPYTFVWSNGRTTANNTGLTAATYSVTVTDNIGCSSIGTTTVSQPAAINPVSSIGNVSCFGGNNGFINNNTSGGTLPYSFVWSNGATTPNLSGLTAATYSFTVTDGAGCSVVKNANVGQPSALVVSFNNGNSACFGSATGNSTASVTGGTSPFSFVWSNGQTNNAATGLAAGVYTLTATDANFCTTSNAVTITQSTALTISTTSTNVSCVNGADGTATATVSGGNAPYNFAWSNGSLVNTASNLTVGNWVVTATDANGCAISDTTVVSNTLISLNPVVTGASCSLGTDGSALIQPNGGAAPYTYAWSNGSSAAFNTNLSAGIYVVTVNDASGCNPNILAITITQPTGLLDSVAVVGASCPTCTDGQAAIFITGGASPYTFAWSNGSTGSQISSLGIGTYFVTITDANNCVLFANANVTLVSSVAYAWANELQIFPNPTQQYLNLRSLPFGSKLLLYNSLGQLVLTKNEAQEQEVLDLSNLNPNVYLLQIQHNGQQISVKIVKTE